uniref:Hyaluronidase n=1 Tax=Lepisosteus oculatus TaxID=7918 RepID=W5NA58_LEPOC
NHTLTAAMLSALALLSLWALGGALGPRQTPVPLVPDVPFLTVWNAPTEPCMSKYGVDLDLSLFNIVLNQNQSFMGDNITIFYEGKLGRYPHYTTRGEAVNGGVPQNASLPAHLRAAGADIAADIPRRGFRGLAVVDWESWRPLWARNWDTKQVYWEASRALARRGHPDWPPSRVESEAQRAFQGAARAFMEGTLRLGRAMRPGGLWGFYGFPACYNYQYKNSTANYSGECPPLEMRRNDQLAWLWNASSALFPDIYLDLALRGREDAILRFTHHRVLEAMRAAGQVGRVAPPVLPYARIAYTYSMEFLSQEDLAHTIGESAALGAAGVVLWGDATYAKSQAVCEEMKRYVDATLGGYLVNVTAAVTLCSRLLCSGRGRCQRRDSGPPGASLHLDPSSWTVASEPGPRGRLYSVRGRPGQREAEQLEAGFVCRCYQGWGGRRCKKPV